MNVLRWSVKFSEVCIPGLPKRRCWFFVKFAIFCHVGAPEENGIDMAIFVEPFYSRVLFGRLGLPKDDNNK